MEWFIPPIYGEIGDGLLLFYTYYLFWGLFAVSGILRFHDMRKTISFVSGLRMIISSPGDREFPQTLTESFVEIIRYSDGP